MKLDNESRVGLYLVNDPDSNLLSSGRVKQSVSFATGSNKCLVCWSI